MIVRMRDIASLEHALEYREQCRQERFAVHTVVSHSQGVWDCRRRANLGGYQLETVVGAGWVLISYMTQPETP